MYRDDFLKEAERIVCSDRESQYGAPEDSFGLIAELWTAYLGSETIQVGPEDVAAMMTLLKIARIRNGVFKADSWIDAIGYLACGAEVACNDSDGLRILTVGGKHRAE